MAGLKVLRLYEQHAAAWDDEFRRVSDRFADRMQCRKGCSMCCSQMFGISPLEAEAIARAVAGLPAADRERLRARAQAYVQEARAMGLGGDGSESVTPRVGARLRCPALDGDACSIYTSRPLICRKWGIPVFDPSKPHQLHACELNFRAGESIGAGDLVDGQAALLEEWVALKDRIRDELGVGGPALTIAEAILRDPVLVDE